ncbi:fungal-specific transcription factor domain-containing protein [Xylariales sp. PMI_506]|nr:fungal-specific transcription factor domain-containing protein [Xylariales sp. PMI_506]
MASETSELVRSPEPQIADTTTQDATQTQVDFETAGGNSPSKKRSASESDPNGPPKVTKRRAARACVSCRARKVRCDVVEGAPCGNCRWDNVECVVQESRRRKKNVFDPNSAGGAHPHVHQKAEAQKPHGTSNPISISPAPELRRQSEVSIAATNSNDATNRQVQPAPLEAAGHGHVPHLIYQQPQSVQPDPLVLAQLQAGNNLPRYPSIWPNPHGSGQNNSSNSTFGDLKTAQFLSSLEEPDVSAQLPAFIRPLPAKITPEDVNYLHIKGALTLPPPQLQNALLRAYVEYVHPYMPLMELHDFLGAINSVDGLCGQVSLFLYHAVMFAGTAYIDMKYLREAGYSNRKAARKVYFQKTRLLYDFDYESDRLILIQSLLLMTYWYETPDDQKDTWHWMGVAISLAHTIGLHRNPANTHMSLRKQKLWKRIWWSCFMRDRLIALGMRRPTRIKDEDFDVPMLEESDFEIGPLPDEVQVVNHDCTLARDVLMQQQLALMCVAKSKLCLCIGEMLKAQYSVLVRDNERPENTTNSTMMLHPKKQLDNLEIVTECDISLMAWAEQLPPCCQYRGLTSIDVKDGHRTIAVQRNLLHMVYYTTISALHRPQFLHASPSHAPTASRQAQELSRMKVRDAATQITRMATEMHQLRLEKYLPTTGVTVVLPAMIIHLLEMKNPVPQARDRAVKGFRHCMKVMERLRDIYAAADYAVAFLDAALRKAAVDLQAAHTVMIGEAANKVATPFTMPAATPDKMATPPPENAPYMTRSEADMLHAGSAYATPADVAAGNSPPHTDKESLTPSTSGSSDGPPPLDVDMDFSENQQDEFDWNALTGTNIDFDQWLQFPADGVKKNTVPVVAPPSNEVVDDSFMSMLTDGTLPGSGLDPGNAMVTDEVFAA